MKFGSVMRTENYIFGSSETKLLDTMIRLIILTCAILIISCNGNKSYQVLKPILENKLEEVLEKFEPTNNAFLFTVFHEDTAIIQVIHRSYITSTRQPNDQFGLAINLTFDQTFPQEIEHHQRFKEMDIARMFDYYEWDGIPCYATDIGQDASKGAEILTILLTDLYGFDSKSDFEIELLDQGNLK